jgi:hypothetical protein
MTRALAAIFLALQVGAGFGAASAELISTTSNAMEIELRVEVHESAESVLAHLAFEDEDPLLFPLVQRESGVFGIRTEVKTVNYQVVFEIIGPDNFRSDQHSLMELGLVLPATDPTVTSSTQAESIITDATQRWGWLALALGAAALSALAFWVLGGNDRDQESLGTGSDSVDVESGA